MKLKATAAALAAAAMVSWAPAAVAQVADSDPALQQTVTADEQIAPEGEHTVLSEGHADLGATYADGQLEFMVRDDSQVPPVWRHLNDVVIQVGDAAIQTLPDTGDFDFTGAKGGDDVWVIPQNQVAGVPWLGWNTQAPSLLDHATSGVSLEFTGHDGPGDFSLFIQPGGFHEPQQLWNSQLEGSQPMWVEPNTHTHANWVFTEPGVHLIGIRAVVKGANDEPDTDEQVLRLAVGDGVSTDDAFAAQFNPAGSDNAASGSNSRVWITVGVIVAILVLAVGIFAAVRALRAKK